MKAHFAIALSIVASLCCLGTGCSKQRLDIVIQGPWILYQDTQFDKDGRKVPVLVAIAPTDALSYGGAADNPDHPHLHHIPQVSAGDGYWIDTPGIYCLTFDGECAPHRAASLQHDGYAEPDLLPVKFPPPPDGSSHWDWVSAVGNKNTALIIPMPDSYSSGGTWFMRFAPSFDGTGKTYVDWPSNQPRHTIGIGLHFAHGPMVVNVLGCGPKPSAGNCNIQPDPKKDPKVSRRPLENTGTLSVVMKAPEHESACDWHVRYAYHTMLTLIDPTHDLEQNHNINQTIGYLEPARDEDTTGPEYEKNDDPKQNYCLSLDPQKPPFHPNTGAISSPAAMKAPMANVLPFMSLAGAIDQAFSCSPNGTPSESKALDSARAICSESEQIKIASEGLDLDMPRISQLRWIMTLVHEVHQDLPKEDKFNNLRQLLDATLEADPGKSANDCLAAQVEAQP